MFDAEISLRQCVYREIILQLKVSGCLKCLGNLFATQTNLFTMHGDGRCLLNSCTMLQSESHQENLLIAYMKNNGADQNAETYLCCSLLELRL